MFIDTVTNEVWKHLSGFHDGVLWKSATIKKKIIKQSSQIKNKIKMFFCVHLSYILFTKQSP